MPGLGRINTLETQAFKETVFRDWYRGLKVVTYYRNIADKSKTFQRHTVVSEKVFKILNIKKMCSLCTVYWIHGFAYNFVFAE